MKNTLIYQLATKAAENAVNNLQSFEKEMYTGTGGENGCYYVCSLRNNIIDTYYEEYSEEIPTQILFDELADAMVL